jgi:hypothetical protein
MVFSLSEDMEHQTVESLVNEESEGMWRDGAME